MRIIFSIGRYWPAVGGAELLTRELAWRLASSHEVEVVTLVNNNDPDFLGRLRRPPHEGFYLDGPVSVHLLRAAGVRRALLEAYIQLACRSRFPRTQQTLFAAVYRPRLEALIAAADLVHSLPAMSISLLTLTAEIVSDRSLPFVITPHLHEEEEALRIQDLLLRADGVIALTSVERDWIASAGVSAGKIEVTGIGPVLPVIPEGGGFRARYGLNGPLVLFIGRKEAYKGYRQILQAAPAVWQKEPQTAFVFIGPRTAESCQDFLPWKGEPRILELPAVDEQEKAEALADCDLLCVPSTRESFGQVFLEAWSAGKPVIAADIPVERAIIKEGEDGLLVSQEASAIAEAILRLVINPQSARQMGEKGRLKVWHHYNWERVSSHTVAFYERLVQKRSLSTCPSVAF